MRKLFPWPRHIISMSSMISTRVKDKKMKLDSSRTKICSDLHVQIPERQTLFPLCAKRPIFNSWTNWPLIIAREGKSALHQ